MWENEPPKRSMPPQPPFGRGELDRGKLVGLVRRAQVEIAPVKVLKVWPFEGTRRRVVAHRSEVVEHVRDPRC